MALEQSGIWLNITPSKKAISVKLPDGTFLIAPISQLERLLKGEIQGVQLQTVINEEKV